MKRGDTHLQHDPPSNFDELILKMDQMSYKDLAWVLQRFNRRYTTKPGAQLARLQTLDENTRQVFVDSFYQQYIPSNLESSTHGKWMDPRIDGPVRKSAYVNRIHALSFSF